MTSLKKALLVDGFADFNAAKTAINLIRYDRENIVALIDSTRPNGLVAQDVFGLGGDIPFVSSIHDAPDADQLILGTVPPGGALNEWWRIFIRDAIERGWDIISGLHEFLTLDDEFSNLAKQHNVKLHDVRMPNHREVATRKDIRNECLRIHTVGNDCNVGKMVTSYELVNSLKYMGQRAQFVATGQTGIMIAGAGIPMDSITADFVNGAAEQLVRQNQHHDIIVIEGQGSLTNPMFSSVTLGLLHGSMPDGLILCYEAGRKNFRHMDVPIPELSDLIPLYEAIASINHPCKVIGIGMNSRMLSEDEAEREREQVAARLGLPVVDVIRDGNALGLSDAVMQLKQDLGK